jgi:hypothetical protein
LNGNIEYGSSVPQGIIEVIISLGRREWMEATVGMNLVIYKPSKKVDFQLICL